MSEKPLFTLNIHQAFKNYSWSYNHFTNPNNTNPLKQNSLKRVRDKLARSATIKKFLNKYILDAPITSEQLEAKLKSGALIRTWNVQVYWSKIKSLFLDAESNSKKEPDVNRLYKLLSPSQESILNKKFFSDPTAKSLIFKVSSRHLESRWFRAFTFSDLKQFESELVSYFEEQSKFPNPPNLSKVLNKIPKNSDMSDDLWSALGKCVSQKRVSNSVLKNFIKKCPSPSKFLTNSDFEVRELAKKEMKLPNKSIQVGPKVRREIKKMARETFEGANLVKNYLCNIDNLTLDNEPIHFKLDCLYRRSDGNYAIRLFIRNKFCFRMDSKILDWVPSLKGSSYLYQTSWITELQFKPQDYQNFLNFMRNDFFRGLQKYLKVIK